MRNLIFVLAVLGGASALAAGVRSQTVSADSAPAGDVISPDVKRIECDLVNRAGDHQTITPNVYEHNGKHYAAVSGYYTNSGGRVDRTDFFYETRISVLDNGTTWIQFYNGETHFQNDRELNLFTRDFQFAKLMQTVFQPGTGGYGPGGIPESTTEDRVYRCEFIRVSAQKK